MSKMAFPIDAYLIPKQQLAGRLMLTHHARVYVYAEWVDKSVC